MEKEIIKLVLGMSPAVIKVLILSFRAFYNNTDIRIPAEVFEDLGKASEKTIDGFADILIDRLINKRWKEISLNTHVQKLIAKAITNRLNLIVEDTSYQKAKCNLEEKDRQRLRKIASKASELWMTLSKHPSFGAFESESSLKRYVLKQFSEEDLFPDEKTWYSFISVLDSPPPLDKSQNLFYRESFILKEGKRKIAQNLAINIQQDIFNALKEGFERNTDYTLRLCEEISKLILSELEGTAQEVSDLVSKADSIHAELVSKSKEIKQLAMAIIKINEKIQTNNDLMKDFKYSYGIISLQLDEIESKLNDIMEEVIPRPLLDLPVMDEHREASNSGRGYLFHEQLTELVGRSKEIDMLNDFINSSEPFSCEFLFGPGGIGKSRLAYHLALSLPKDWETGFLIWESTDKSWEKWRLKKSTLIIMDMALSHLDEVKKCILELLHVSQKPHNKKYKIRVLLLDRFFSDEIEERIFGAENIDSRLKNLIWFEPHEINPPKPNEVLTIIENVHLVRRKETHKEPVTPVPPYMNERKKLWNELREMTLEGRPFLVICAADALFDKGRASMHKWDATRLVADAINKERSKWEDMAKSLRKLSSLDLYENLLAIATIQNGLYYPDGYKAIWLEFEELNIEELIPTPRDLNTSKLLLKTMCALSPPNNKEGIPPLKPDFLGTLFLLNHLSRLDETQRIFFLDSIFKVKWEKLPLIQTIHLCIRDHPKHKMTTWILENIKPNTKLKNLWHGLKQQGPWVLFYLGMAARESNFLKYSEKLFECAVFADTDGLLSNDISFFARIINPKLKAATLKEKTLFILEFAEATCKKKKYEFEEVCKLGLLLKAYAVGEIQPDPKNRDKKDLLKESEQCFRKAIELNFKETVTEKTSLASLLESYVDKTQQDPKCRTVKELAEEAEKWYKEAVIHEPPNYFAHAKLSAFLVKKGLSQGDITEGLKLTEKTFNLIPQETPSRWALFVSFLLFVYGDINQRNDAISRLKFNLLKNAKLYKSFHTPCHIEYAKEKQHPEANWLCRLSEVINGIASVDTLNSWKVWNDA